MKHKKRGIGWVVEFSTTLCRAFSHSTFSSKKEKPENFFFEKFFSDVRIENYEIPVSSTKQPISPVDLKGIPGETYINNANNSISNGGLTNELDVSMQVGVATGGLGFAVDWDRGLAFTTTSGMVLGAGADFSVSASVRKYQVF